MNLRDIGIMDSFLWLCATSLQEPTESGQLQSALTIKNESTRGHILALLAPHMTDPTHLRQIRHQIAADVHSVFRLSTRGDLLHYLATPGLFAPPIFTPDEVAAVAEAIIDVTTKWRWL